MILGKQHWLLAGALALVLHVVAFISLRPLPAGKTTKGSGPQIQMLGSTSAVFGSQQVIAEESEGEASEESAAQVEALEPEKIDEARPEPQAVEPAEEVETAETSPAGPLVPDAVAPETTKSQALKPEAVRAEAAREKDRTRPRKHSARKAKAEPRKAKPSSATRTAKRKKQRKSRKGGKSGNLTASARKGGGRQRASANPGAVRRYAAVVRAQIARNRPPSARHAGTAIVTFALTQAGRLRYVRLTRSSGSTALDRASVASVRRAAPFPRPPQGMTARQLRFAIPFRFR